MVYGEREEIWLGRWDGEKGFRIVDESFLEKGRREKGALFFLEVCRSSCLMGLV